MKNKFYAFIFCALLLFCGCSGTQKFTFKYFNFDSDREMKLKAQVPKNFKIIRINDKETKLLYKDSSAIFFSFDKLSGTSTNQENRFNKGIDVVFRQHYNDSVFLEGSDKNMLHWKEYFLDDIIVGYLKVPEEKKEIFDKVIKSVNRNF